MEKLDHCFAVVAGERRCFRLRRSQLTSFEGHLGNFAGGPPSYGSAFGTLKRLLGGGWTINDLRRVLAYGWAGGHEGGRYPMPELGAAADFAEACTREVPGAFVVLAAKILEAALFGIDPADAEVAIGTGEPASAAA